VLDLHRTPQLASPTLLVVGEVVRLVDPASTVERLVVPDLSPGKDSVLPPAFFKTVLSRPGADEEAMA